MGLPEVLTLRLSATRDQYTNEAISLITTSLYCSPFHADKRCKLVGGRRNIRRVCIGLKQAISNVVNVDL